MCAGKTVEPGSQATVSAAPRRTSRLALIVTVAVGILVGLALLAFGYGEGTAYLSNSPESCINCHVMQPQYDSWLNSSHKNVAVCNDCHLPHDAVGKWIVKGDNGFFHSLAFTTNDFHEPIQIKPRNRLVTQGACIHCHSDLVDPMKPAHPGGDMLLCVQCHADVGHAGR